MTLPVDQGDLFALDSPLLKEVRGERSLMAFPFFALSKGKWTKPLTYQTESVSIEIIATPKGVATIYDKEVLLYIASLMVAKMEAGMQPAQDFQFSAHDLFRVTGDGGSPINQQTCCLYKLLVNANLSEGTRDLTPYRPLRPRSAQLGLQFGIDTGRC